MTWETARELDAYRDEPPQMPSGTVGKQGFLRLGFERRGPKTALIDLRRRAPLFVHKALYWDEALPTMPCVFLITTTGCVLQGDRLEMEVDLAADTQAHLTTQSATQIHSMNANYAAQTQDIVLGENAYLEFLPDPICPHANSRFHSSTRLCVAPSATLLYGETLMSGRKHHKGGERFAYDLFSCSLRCERPDGTELMTEKYVLEPARQDPRHRLGMGDFDVFANVVLLTPPATADEVLAQTGAFFEPEEGVAAGACRLPNQAGLSYKVLGRESGPVQKRVREFWSRVRKSVTGAEPGPAFLWR